MKESIKRASAGKRSFPWLKTGFLLVMGGAVGLCFTSFPSKVKQGLRDLFKGETKVIYEDQTEIKRQVEARLRADMDKELERKVAEVRQDADRKVAAVENEYKSRPLQLPLGTVTDVRKLRSGIPFVTQVTMDAGGVASKERIDDQSYTATYQLHLRMPEPAKTLADLESLNPSLSKMFPGITKWMEKPTVSRWYYRIYENKVERIRREANTLNEVLTKHNLYDCETILELTAGKDRKVFLMQAEMDVVSDGSDGDRLPTMPDEIVNSSYYQPFTSYGWPKKTHTPNPLVDGWTKRIAEGKKELADSATTAERKNWLKDRLETLKRGIEDMKARSFLIAEYDPFIVLPTSVLSSSDSFAPKVGDFAVVVFGEKLYPAIVGDGGPIFKVGEASLRMAVELNKKASSYSRPVSDLKVTYVVFPGSRDEQKGPPDYAKWRDRCKELLTEAGGLGEGYEIHTWEDLIPKPEPAVVDPKVDPAPASGGVAPAGAPKSPAPAGTGRSE